MDLLDRVLGPARDLLARVDTTFTAAGAPPEHQIWPLLRRVGALPGEALECVAELSPDPLADVAIQLRARSDGYARQQANLASTIAAGRWDGTAGTAFGATWGAVGEYLGDGESSQEPSMAGRLMALRGYLDDVGDWISGSRTRLAGALAEVLGSAEAVALRSSTATQTEAAGAAAAIGARVLAAVDDAVARGHDVSTRWASRLGEVPFHAPEIDYTVSGQTHVEM